MSDRSVPVELRRSPGARRLTLRVSPSGAVALTVPARTPLKEAQRFLDKYRGWLEARLARLPAPIPFAPGAVLPLRGVPHTIRHAPGARRGVWIEDGTILVSGAREHLARRVGDWLRCEARTDLAERARIHASALDRPVLRVGVRDTVSRWGSCSSTGTLSFSWRLILMPPSVLDYVAAHEAAHLVERNHGPRFWAIVRKLDPDCDAARAWLRNHGAGLHRYGALPPAEAVTGTARESGRAGPR